MLKYWVWLSELKGLRNQTKLALLRRFGDPESIFYADPDELMLTEGADPGQLKLLENHDLAPADKILADCQRLDIQLLTFSDAAYPGRLKNIYDPPALLYYKGKLPLLDDLLSVAVVGTRDCTPYGVTCAEKLGFGLASGGAVVVSGLAKGIDAAATRGALRAGGVTIGVTGNGLDVHYPYESRYLYEDVAASGVLFSEYPPGTEPAPGHFPVPEPYSFRPVLSGSGGGSAGTERCADHRYDGSGAGPGRVCGPRSHRRAYQRGLQPSDPGRRGAGNGCVRHFAGV